MKKKEKKQKIKKERKDGYRTACNRVYKRVGERRTLCCRDKKENRFAGRYRENRYGNTQLRE